MKYFCKKIVILGCTGAMITMLTGCDLFSPSKKETKTPTTATAVPSTPPPTMENTDQGPLPADVIARVGSWRLSAEEFDLRLKLLKQGLPDFNDKDPQTKATVLNELIRQQLLVKDAETSNIAEQKDIKDAVEDFRRSLLVQELANRLTKGVSASEAEAQKYYDTNKDAFINWKVRQIVVPEEATAKTILVQVLQGGDFAAIAKEQSKDKTASNGGLIEDVVKTPLEVRKAIVGLETGGTSNVFKGPQGYYIIHVDEKAYESFASLKTKLIADLTLRKQQNAILEYIDKLAQKSKIEVNKDLLGLNETKKP